MSGVAPPVQQLGPAVLFQGSAPAELLQLAMVGAQMRRRNGVPLNPFTRSLLAALADAARHRDMDPRSPHVAGDTSAGVDRPQSQWVGTAEAAGVIGLSVRSVQRLRHAIGFRRTASGRFEFDRAAVEAFAQMRERKREEQDG